MNKILSFVRLDYITVKPYLTVKNLFLVIVVALIMTTTSDSNATVIGMIMVYAVLFGSYPFAVGEQNGIDALYMTLTVKRSAVVVGRYLFALSFDACIGLLAYVVTFIISIVLNREFDALESLSILLVLFLLYSFIQFIQLPIYFKLGYAKAKFAAYLPLLGIGLISVVFSKFFEDTFLIQHVTNFFAWLAANPFAAVLIGLGLWFVVMVISLRISLTFYSRRDF